MPEVIEIRVDELQPHAIKVLVEMLEDQPREPGEADARVTRLRRLYRDLTGETL
jgi:hypothetical protein